MAPSNAIRPGLRPWPSVIVSARWLVIVLMLLHAIGCGSSSGGGSGSGAAGGSAVTTLGTRVLPGWTVTVKRQSDQGALAVFTIVVVGDGGALPAAVEGGYQVDGDAPVLVSLTAQAGQPTQFPYMTSTLPSLGTVRIWVRITDADGNIVESGPSDFHVSG